MLDFPAGKLVLTIHDDGVFSLATPDGATGWKGLALTAEIDGRTVAGRATSVEPAGSGAAVVLDYGGGLSERASFEVLAGPSALVVERVFTNAGDSGVRVDSVATTLATDRSGLLLDGRGPGSLKVIHVSNLRQSAYRASHAVGPFLCPLPEYDRLIGDSEFHPFPALAIGPGLEGPYLLEAATQQDVFTQMWRIRAQYDPKWTHTILADYAAIARDGRRQAVTLSPGRSRRLSGLFYQLKEGGLQDLWDDYLAELAWRVDFRGKRSVLLTETFYCTWNYTFYHDINHDTLAAQAAVIRDRLPNVKHFLIDDGYQVPDANPTYDCGRFYPNPGGNFDRVKFPHGMRAVSDMLRDHGLKPALWWSPAMGRANRLVAEHADWLCLDEDGRDWSMDSGPARKAALDFSVPAVREFIERVLEAIFVEWGFEGMKLDFCTYPFDCKDLRFRGGEGVRWWYWFLETIAKFIPEGGIFQLCGGAPNGNPFMARYVDHHRVGGDIGKGEWERHVSTSRSPLPLLAAPGRATMLMDVDSAGICHAMSDRENLHRLNWCFITSGALNLGGDLTKLSDKQLGWLRRITDDADRGYKVRCPDGRAFLGLPQPDALYVDYPADSPTVRRGIAKHAAYFNWNDAPRTVGYALATLGIPAGATIRDFWSGEKVAPVDGQLVAVMDGRDSILYEVLV